MTLGAVLRTRLSAAGLQIAHVKLFLRAGKRVWALSIPSNDAPSDLSQRAEGTASIVDLMVNARVAAVPDVLRDIVEACLRAWTDTPSRGTTLLKDFRARGPVQPPYTSMLQVKEPRRR